MNPRIIQGETEQPSHVYLGLLGCQVVLTVRVVRRCRLGTGRSSAKVELVLCAGSPVQVQPSVP